MLISAFSQTVIFLKVKKIPSSSFLFPLLEIAQVIAAYTATGAEQLTLAPGQLILIRKKNPGGWWEGELQVHQHCPTWTNDYQVVLTWITCLLEL